MLFVKHERLDFFQNIPKSDWFIIACQNIRSIKSHVDDILADEIMMESDALCITETSLGKESWPKLQEFSKFNIFTRSRNESYDRDDRCKRKSGGVALLAKHELCCNIDKTFDDIQNIELISGIIHFKSQDSIQEIIVAVLYKDHMGNNMSMKSELLGIMRQIFDFTGKKKGDNKCSFFANRFQVNIS